ncbi:hypothetical protein [Marixanthomonas ophiurae]|uniref:hypothetical protein n=1 Tax=Marixanthomonas ophiurae TaxID=387659 RepID=UPI0011C031E9|nr:hypothetical protein [Marixanthomonas ophiurae]
MFLNFLGLLYNILIFFKTDTLSNEYKFLSAGFIGVLTAFVVFNGGLMVLLYVKNFNFIEANNLKRFLDNIMLMKFSTVAAVGNISLWLGYKAKLGDYLFSIYYLKLGYKRLLNLDIRPFFPKALIIFGLSINLILFINGAYGRGLAEAEDFSGVFRYLVEFSSYFEKIALIGYFILALLHFKTGEHKTWFRVSLFLQVLFALVSGARGPIIFLFILTILPYYYVHKKITLKIIFGGLVVILVAFTVASEIKRFTQNFNKTDISLTEYVDAYFEYREKSNAELDKKIYESLYYNIVLRLSMVTAGSIAIEYEDQQGLDEFDPDFHHELQMIPVSVIVPRSKVFGTSFPSWGNWFRLKVLGFSDTYFSNTSFGSVAFFYFAGRWVFVVVGFFLYGVSLRFSNNILELGTGVSFLIYLAILSAIGFITASIPSAFVSFFRFVFFLPLIFYFIVYFFNKLRIY